MKRLLPTVQTVYGKDGVYDTPYLTRVAWGPFFVHVFHRGDNDPDPHDHRRAFWTFPLTSYVEESVVGDPGAPGAYLSRSVVRAFHLHRREATHAHRLLGRWRGQMTVNPVPGTAARLQRLDPLACDRSRVVTLGMWDHREPPREWGFWRFRWAGGPADPRFTFVPWREYIFGREVAPDPEP